MQKADATPLLRYLQSATPEQRERCALLAGTSVNYLYQLATCRRPNISAAKALGIEDATRQIHSETNGALPILEVRTLVTMCAVQGLDA